VTQISSPKQDRVEADELWVVVPAAGSGTRLPSACPKQYLELKGRCLLQRAIDTLSLIPDVKGVVVVLAKDDTLWPKIPASKNPLVMTTTGGASRAESVVAGLQIIRKHSSNDSAMVMVHDAARALTSVDDIVRLIDRVKLAPEQGGLLATKVQDTLKRAKVTTDSSDNQHAVIEATVSRDDLWQAQTPQMFRTNALLDCLMENQQAIATGDITDEACAMEKSGFAPALVEALHPNFKITHLRDFNMALAIMQQPELMGADSKGELPGNASVSAQT